MRPVSDYSEPWLHQLYVVSVSKTRYSHCFSSLSCEMSTRLKHHREGCLFSAMSPPEEIAHKNQRIFLLSVIVFQERHKSEKNLYIYIDAPAKLSLTFLNQK